MGNISNIDKESLSLGYFSISGNFFHLVVNVLNETIKQGNTDIYFGPVRDDIEEYYSTITKWSDFRIIIPILFNFFHGIELYLKGAIYKARHPEKRPSHKLGDMLNEFKRLYPDANKTFYILNKYIHPNKTDCNILFEFYSANNIKDSSGFIEFFKYPYSRDFSADFQHILIKNTGHEGIVFYKGIIEDINIIRAERTKL